MIFLISTMKPIFSDLLLKNCMNKNLGTYTMVLTLFVKQMNSGNFTF